MKHDDNGTVETAPVARKFEHEVKTLLRRSKHNDAAFRVQNMKS
jgi:hypothetical protein